MQFSCEICGQLFRLNDDGYLACKCGRMSKKQDHAICRMLLAAFFGIDIDQERKEVKADA